MFFQNGGAVNEAVLNSYCWMYSSFTIPLNFKGACTKREHDGSNLYNSYYQWVSLFLVVSALLFYAPRWVSVLPTLVLLFSQIKKLKNFREIDFIHEFDWFHEKIPFLSNFVVLLYILMSQSSLMKKFGISGTYFSARLPFDLWFSRKKTITNKFWHF